MPAPLPKYRVVALENRGRGCVAIKGIAAGEAIAAERPALALQTPLNSLSSWACSACLAPLGSLRGQLLRLGLGGEPPLLDADDAFDAAKGAPLRCPTCDDDRRAQWYCCEACRVSDWEKRHAAFCSASAAHRAASLRFRDFAAAKLHPLSLAADMVACALRGGPRWLAGEGLCASPWSEIIPRLEGVPAAEDGAFRASCLDDATRGLKLFREALALSPDWRDYSAQLAAMGAQVSTSLCLHRLAPLFVF